MSHLVGFIIPGHIWCRAPLCISHSPDHFQINDAGFKLFVTNLVQSVILAILMTRCHGIDAIEIAKINAVNYERSFMLTDRGKSE